MSVATRIWIHKFYAAGYAVNFEYWSETKTETPPKVQEFAEEMARGHAELLLRGRVETMVYVRAHMQLAEFVAIFDERMTARCAHQASLFLGERASENPMSGPQYSDCPCSASAPPRNADLVK
jgi:hypothetical protein